MANNNGYAYTSNPRHNILQSRRFSINQSTDRKNQRDIRHCTLRKHLPQTSETKKRRTAQPRPHRKILQHQTELPKLPTDRHVNRNGTREKKNFLAKRNDQILFLTEIDKLLNETETIRSVSSINPTKNIKLNKTELLFLLRKTPEYHNETLQLYKEMLKLQKKRNLKINSLILDRNDFHEQIKSDEINPLREALSETTTFFGPQAFWSEIKQVTETTEIRNIKDRNKTCQHLQFRPNLQSIQIRIQRIRSPTGQRKNILHRIHNNRNTASRRRKTNRSHTNNPCKKQLQKQHLGIPNPKI